MFLPLVLVLFVGVNWCNGVLDEAIRFNDGEADGSNPQARNLVIQEGAVVDLVCKANNDAWGYPYLDVLYQYYYGVDYVNKGWTLTSYFVATDRIYAPNTAEVDPDTFPNEENWEPFHSIITYDLSAIYSNGGPWTNGRFGFGRHLSTLRYTARIEDNNKWLTCRHKVVGETQPDPFGTVRLLVRPGPSPLIFHSKIVHKWRGGFIGEITVPISDYFTSWKIILEFPKKVFGLSGGGFQLANEPCLHDPHCGDDSKKTWVIYNTFATRVLNLGTDLHLNFYAETSPKYGLGYRAKVKFYGYNQVFHTDVEPYSSSSDVQLNNLHSSSSASSSSSSSSSSEPEPEMEGGLSLEV